jgi:iron complex transport system ATP-binding protein
MGLKAKGVTLRFRRRPVLESVDFTLRPGRLVGLLGANGAGKTTLLRVLAGLLVPDSGLVQFDGQPLKAWPRRHLARRIAYLAQGAPCHWPLTVERLVALGRLPHLEPWRGVGQADWAAVRRAMEETDVFHLAGRTVTTLSGGERMRVLLARVLAGAPSVLLADEPTAALDPAHRIRTMKLLRGLSEAGRSVVVVLHDLTLAARFCDEVAVLSNGRVLASGHASEVFTPANLEAAFHIRAEFGERDGSPVVVPWEDLPEVPPSPAAGIAAKGGVE